MGATVPTLGYFSTDQARERNRRLAEKLVAAGVTPGELRDVLGPHRSYRQRNIDDVIGDPLGHLADPLNPFY